MFARIKEFFRPLSIPCPCGGRIVEYFSWRESSYHCRDCALTLAENDFHRRIDEIKQAAHDLKDDNSRRNS